jgi:hypothetical protein
MMKVKNIKELLNEVEFKKYIDESNLIFGIDVRKILEMLWNSKATNIYLSLGAGEFDLTIYTDYRYEKCRLTVEFENPQGMRRFMIAYDRS